MPYPTRKNIVLCDTECYRDYWLISFKSAADRTRVKSFELYFGHPLDYDGIRTILSRNTIVTFNGNNYDIPIITYALSGVGTEKLKKLSDRIIQRNLRSWQVYDELGIKPPKYLDHIDLIEVAPGMASLKIYGGRLHSKRMQDLPIEPDAVIGQNERKQLLPYCENDLDTTGDLSDKLRPQIGLREQMSHQYGIDLRSKSDAQIAEAIIKSEVEKMVGDRIYKPKVPTVASFTYDPPAFLRFQSSELREILAISMETEIYVVDGDVKLPKALEGLSVAIGSSVYRMGIGGLHSSESCQAFASDDEHLLRDADVTSYYPYIIVNNRLTPEHIGDVFFKVYESILARRVKAKEVGDKVTDAVLKIVLNGSFGKFGSKYSVLYAPKLMIQVTLTGQLSLLMLIERLEAAGIPVISANTDGIVSRIPRDLLGVYGSICQEWQRETRFELTFADYAKLCSRDVNNYFAVKPDGSVKRKGVYAEAALNKNPQAGIVADAVEAYLAKGVPLARTIYRCEDVRKFIVVRSVKGGGVWRDQYLGKAVRWIYGIGGESIHYKTNGNKVATSDGAIPLMELPDQFPAKQIDYGKYIDMASAILRDIGAHKLPGDEL